MPIQRLNHAVLFVRDVKRSVDFYSKALGFQIIRDFASSVPPTGRRFAFLRASGSTNDHDLGLFEIGADADASPAGDTAVGLLHLAWEVDTLAELERIAKNLTELDALFRTADHFTTKALYAKDLDGIDFEVTWVVPAQLLTEETLAVQGGWGPLDITAEQARYGAETKGGVGASLPAESYSPIRQA